MFDFFFPFISNSFLSPVISFLLEGSGVFVFYCVFFCVHLFEVFSFFLDFFSPFLSDRRINHLPAVYKVYFFFES